MADITVTGIIGQDASLKFTPGGDAVLNFSVADDLRRKNGDRWETVSTTWWPVALWGKQAEAMAEHLRKGTRVVVIGTVHERKYTHQEQERSSFDVKARTVAVVPRDEVQRSSGQQSDAWATPQGGSFSGEPAF